MERIRVAGIVKINNGFALIHRTGVIKRKDFQEYYTFPGGGVEIGESIEVACIREIKEELGINVKITEKLYEIYSENLNQQEYFFLCEYVDGKFGTGDGPEFNNNPKYINSGNFIPEIIEKENINELVLLPSEIKERFINDIKSGKL